LQVTFDVPCHGLQHLLIQHENVEIFSVLPPLHKPAIPRLGVVIDDLQKLGFVYRRARDNVIAETRRLSAIELLGIKHPVASEITYSAQNMPNYSLSEIKIPAPPASGIPLKKAAPPAPFEELLLLQSRAAPAVLPVMRQKATGPLTCHRLGTRRRRFSLGLPDLRPDRQCRCPRSGCPLKQAWGLKKRVT
jgi:hypothetical protein